jgi:hypothetical protein
VSDVEKTVLESKLDEFSNRLRARNAELRKSGEFSDTHRALSTEIKQRSDALRKRVKQTETAGSAWELVKAKFARDFSSLYDDLLQLEDRLDSEVMKKR